jgi:hypothetical protein
MQTRKLASLAGAVAIAMAALAGSAEAQVAAQIAPYPYEERPFGIPNVSEFDPNPPARLEDLRAVQNPPRESRSGPRRMHYSSSAQEPDV